MKKIPSLITCIVFLCFLFILGCEQQQKKDILAPGPDIKMTTPGDYATRAIEAAGGLQKWINTKEINSDCIVTLFRPDGSFYLTEHHYKIYPWANFIQISALEPSGNFVWQLSNGQFSMLQGNIQNDPAPIVPQTPGRTDGPATGLSRPDNWCGAEFYRDYAETVLSIITAPVLFLDNQALFTGVKTKVKIGGQWYDPIRRTVRPPEKKDGAEPVKPYWSKVIFYQNTDTSLVDTLWFADFGDPAPIVHWPDNKTPTKIGTPDFRAIGAGLLVRGYDYSKPERDKILAPAKIEIFKTDERGAVPKRLAEINLR